jgi:hypothetical protein
VAPVHISAAGAEADGVADFAGPKTPAKINAVTAASNSRA